MSTVVVACPRCDRRLGVPETHLGKRVKCPACGEVVATERPAAAAAPAEVPVARVARPALPAREFEPLRFGVRVKHDPSGALRGTYQAELSAEGLRLRKPKGTDVEAQFPVGTPAGAPGGGLLELRAKGRVLTLVVARANMYTGPLAEDIARFLAGELDALDAADYAVPWPLLGLAVLPIGIGIAGMYGGALGGGLGGGAAGGLMAANLAIVRRDRWPLAARVAACVGLNVIGYTALALVLVALAQAARQNQDQAPPPMAARPKPAPVVASEPKSKEVAPAPTPPPAEAAPAVWGTTEDPDGDCNVEVAGDSATIEVPGTVHDLAMPPGKANAPRVVRPVDGDFTAEVRVVGEVKPDGPPAMGYPVAYNGAGLYMRSSGGEMVRLERAAFVRGGRLTSYVNFELHRNAGRPDSFGANVPEGPIRLRLRRRGDQVLGEFSVDDGRNWRRMPPLLLRSSPPRVKAGVAAVNTAARPFTARLENLEIKNP